MRRMGGTGRAFSRHKMRGRKRRQTTRYGIYPPRGGFFGFLGFCSAGAQPRPGREPAERFTVRGKPRPGPAGPERTPPPPPHDGGPLDEPPADPRPTDRHPTPREVYRTMYPVGGLGNF